MKSDELKSEIIYKIVDKSTNEFCGVYSRSYHDVFNFGSINEAINSNVHGIYKDKNNYKISKYRVIYELIEDECESIEENNNECGNDKSL